MDKEEKNGITEENTESQTNEKSNKPHTTYKEKFEFKTEVNDPDLLVGPYVKKEGEAPTIKCPNCGEEMPTTIDTCVNCGHYLKRENNRYKPIDQEKAKKIRWIVGTICVIAFIIYMVLRNSN